jgi:RecB family exonuclease
VLPKTLSASSVNTAELCLARWAAEMLDRSARLSNDAAKLGSSVHGGLEQFVKAVFIDKVMAPTFNNLRMFYMASFGEEFGWIDQQSELYLDGLDLLETWFKRIDEFQEFKVISCEMKETFPLGTTAGEIPFTYIFDRLDQMPDGTIRVVDYKTSRWNVTADELREKIQARAYGVAAQLKFPEAKRIWVQFEMLRHGAPVGVMFTKEQNRNSYRYLRAAAERIIKTPRDDAPETLNSECKFCIRVGTCESVVSNTLAGGIVGMNLKDQIDRYALLDAQRSAVLSALSQLEGAITTQAKKEDWHENEGELARIRFKASRRRYVDSDMVAHIVPHEIWVKYGSQSITLRNFEAMIKDPVLNDSQRAQLRGMVNEGWSEPKLKVEMKKVGEDD